mgnify:CR=1 FL=1
MQQITDYAAVDRELAGRVARFQAVTDTQFEPWHQPHFNAACNQNCRQGRMCDCVPAAEEPTPRAKVDPVPWLTTKRFWLGYIALIAAALLGVHGWFAGWFA